MRYGSLFSGIGGLDLGLERAGWTCAWQVELDEYRRRILAQHWPDVPRHIDVREVSGERLGPVDAIVGGFPCQDLSKAGRRAGLAGARSGLFFEFARLVRELRPRWLLVENVDGLLSSNGGRDFAIVLGELGDLGYGLAWRVLDSRYFGVPQRRRRVFVVGRAGRPCPPEVLALEEGRSRHPRQGGASRAIAAGELARSVGGVGGGDDIGANKGTLVGHAVTGGGTRFDYESEDFVVGPLLAPRFGWNGADEAVAGQLVVGAEADADGVREAPRLSRRLDGGVAAPITSSAGHHGYSSPRGDGADNLVAVPLVFSKQHAANDDEDYESWEATDVAHSRDSFGDARDVVLDGAGTALSAPVDPRPDSPRYRAVGDAVTVPVAEWIGRRMLAVDEGGG